MFIFHEGLPRSGKSYEAMVTRIIPALQEGRKVFARLNGMDYPKIALAAGLTEARVRELLHHIPEEKVLEWHLIVEKDSLVILDEMQNFWPDGVRQIPLEQIKAISEHGHKGLDIVGLGQLLKGKGGCNAVWVNRCDQKIVFEKQNARGADKKYRWTAYKGRVVNGRIQFDKVNSGIKQYDEKYFGTYATRVEGSENAETYKDDRTNIWHNPVFRKWMPLMLIAVAVAVYYLFHMFKGGGFENSLVKTAKPEASHVVTTVTTVPNSSVSAVQPVAPGGPPVAQAQSMDAMASDYVASISNKWRPRLSGMIYDAKRARLYVEWYDDGFRLKERLSAAQLEEMGWGVQKSAYGEHVMLHKLGVHIAVTSWPIEPFGKMSEETNKGIAAAAGNERSRSDG
ncbi:zonular occludens toxin domain-containing protein [Cupriavidus basilensis]|uniref:zonular occludens toxin domain-containing protein n=1 Tax=Cupriavidus basilensis TaxID=68895 RepID=UPI00157A847B|nr:zonular occludens toxin domain-containing protein [Cupriavidus basilensis]NUA30185.1 zonular occludens toxin [Cupriavidus basilensis]